MKQMVAIIAVVAIALMSSALAQTPPGPVNPKTLTLGQSKKYEIRDQLGNLVDATNCFFSPSVTVVTLTKIPAYITLTGAILGTTVPIHWTCNAPTGFTGNASSGSFTINVVNPPWSVTAVGDVEVP